jgi:hypothetical protein
VRRDVIQAKRPWFVGEQPEHAMAGRQIADVVMLGDRQTIGDELHQASVRADDAECAVAGIGHLAGRHHDPRQCAVQVEIATDAHDRLQQRRQPFPAVLPRGFDHGVTAMMAPTASAQSCQPPTAMVSIPMALTG